MFEPFDLNIYQRALLACLMIGFTNGYVSAFVLINRSSLKLSALSHSILPGVAIATWLVGLTVINAFIGASLCAILIGLLAIYFSKKSKLPQDTTLTILYTGAFAFGIMILNKISHSQELEHWLFGNILGLADLDLWMAYGVGLVVVCALGLFRRPILIFLFEQDVAQTLGISVKLLQYLLFALLILVLVTTLQAVGCILAVGLIVTPAATVRLFTHSPPILFTYSGILGALGSATGLYLSYVFNLPAGSSIVLLFTVIFIASAFISQFIKKED